MNTNNNAINEAHEYAMNCVASASRHVSNFSIDNLLAEVYNKNFEFYLTYIEPQAEIRRKEVLLG